MVSRRGIAISALWLDVVALKSLLDFVNAPLGLRRDAFDPVRAGLPGFPSLNHSQHPMPRQGACERVPRSWGSDLPAWSHDIPFAHAAAA